jgi:hypothetical protein
MQTIRQIFALLIVLVQAQPAGSDPSPLNDPALQADLRAAVARGLDWIERHPATLQDGGLPDLLDEGLGYLMLSTLSADNDARQRFAAIFSERMASLAGMPAFAQWVTAGRRRLTDHYHLVLAAHLMHQAGNPSDLQPQIIARAQYALASSPFSDPTKRLTIALFLERLGAEPGISVDQALENSRIERIVRGRPPALPAAGAGPQQRLATTLHLYALVHEIIALTDFGRQPTPAWLENRLAPLNRFLLEAIGWAGASGNVDLLSELLLTARFVDAPLEGILPDVLAQLLDGQREDGSWGEYETRRPNKRRHAVFTATTALWSYALPTTGQAGQ